MKRRVLMAMVCVLAGGSGAVAQETTASKPLADLAKEVFESAAVTKDGQLFQFDMGQRRANWNNARWSVRQFDKPRDLSAFNAVQLTVTTDRPRSDAGVYVALREADGTWRHHPWAVNLTRKTNTGVARFSEFVLPSWVCPPEGRQSDENALLDADKITGVAIGSVNPMGVGKLSFTLTDLRAVKVDEAQPKPLRIEVTGKLIDISGTGKVPAGMFGGYAGPKDPEHKLRLALVRSIMSNQATGGGAGFGPNEITHIRINCAGERIWPSPRLTDRDWQEKTKRLARGMAATGKQAAKRLYVEFWNEPYLNWAKTERANFIPRFYDLSRAAEGGPVHIKHDGQVAPHLRWTKNYDAVPWHWCSRKDWRRGKTADGKQISVHAKPYHRGVAGFYGGAYIPQSHPPEDVKDGQTYIYTDNKGNKMELTAFTPWHIYDETQFTYWAGRGMVKFYLDQMNAFGPTLKAELPEAIFFAGWGMRPSEDKWASFEMLYKPTIDAGIKYIDGCHGHDYGGGPLRENAVAEVITAYGVTKHGKWLKYLNTEMSGMMDPQAYPEAERQTRTRVAKATWLARKILHGLTYTPDKVFGYCMFDFKAENEGMALELLRNVRGKMVQLKCDDPLVYAVASIDGTDPENPRPAFMPKRKELVVAVFNDHARPREIKLNVAAPKGTKLGGLIVRRFEAAPDGNVAVKETQRRAAGTSHTLAETLGPREPVVFTFPLTGNEGVGPEVRRKQVFLKAILANVTPREPVKETIIVDADILKNAERAWVQFVAEDLAPREAVMVINGNEYKMPACVTPDNTPWIRKFALDPAVLKAKNAVEIKIADPKHAGFLLCAAGIVVEGK